MGINCRFGKGSGICIPKRFFSVINAVLSTGLRVGLRLRIGRSPSRGLQSRVA